MPGQGEAEALTHILFGDYNPSGKLTFTMPSRYTQQNFTQEQWPGINNNVTYSEKVHFGYRYYDLNNISPQYEFGFGLSYSEFKYSNFQVYEDRRGFIVDVDVKNLGHMPAKEIVQVYVGKPKTKNYPDEYRSPQDLKGFTKLFL